MLIACCYGPGNYDCAAYALIFLKSKNKFGWGLPGSPHTLLQLINIWKKFSTLTQESFELLIQVSKGLEMAILSKTFLAKIYNFI